MVFRHFGVLMWRFGNSVFRHFDISTPRYLEISVFRSITIQKSAIQKPVQSVGNKIINRCKVTKNV